ncbi:MAG: ABC transporter ATP-binding protein [Fibrobacteres bacterium]|nr:ABC transporter ATP-binding protein [Fibrobacterota bacterium]
MAGLLEVASVTIRFGGLVAVKDLSFTVAEGELFGLIGPNGAGKTTVFNLITGVYAPTAGTIRFAGREVQGRPPHRIAAAGIARTFQNIRLFPDLTVLENVMVSRHMHRRQSLAGAIFRTADFLREEEEFRADALRLLELFQMGHLENEQAANLPYGSQRRLEIARALAAKPRLLLLDEPAAGMNPQESADLMRLIRRVRDEFKVSILLVEHNMKVVMGVCERIQVLVHGEGIAIGEPGAIRSDPKVIEAYLGQEHA